MPATWVSFHMLPGADCWSSILQRPQFGEQGLHGPVQFRQVLPGVCPHAVWLYPVVGMDQEIAEIHDPAQSWNSFGDLGMVVVQAVQCFAYDLEFAFDRGLDQRVGHLVAGVHALDKARDVRCRLVHVCQRAARITPHRQARATC